MISPRSVYVDLYRKPKLNIEIELSFYSGSRIWVNYVKYDITCFFLWVSAFIVCCFVFAEMVEKKSVTHCFHFFSILLCNKF